MPSSINTGILSPSFVKTDGLGCVAQPLPPYTPQRNRAERAIQTVDMMARTMLIDAPHLEFSRYYYDASLAAAYTHNRVVGSRGKTPYELLKLEQPFIKHMIPFGCKGYMHAEIAKRGKKVPSHYRAEEVYMIGYRTPFSTQWKVETLDDERRTLHSIHVDWDIKGHGLTNAIAGGLSRDHLEAIAEETGCSLEFYDQENPNRQPVTAVLQDAVLTENQDNPQPPRASEQILALEGIANDRIPSPYTR